MSKRNMQIGVRNEMRKGKRAYDESEREWLTASKRWVLFIVNGVEERSLCPCVSSRWCREMPARTQESHEGIRPLLLTLVTLLLLF